MECRYCSEEMVFWVFELFKDGNVAVERSEAVCEDCVHDVEPEGLDGAFANYEFKIEPDPESFGMDRTS